MIEADTGSALPWAREAYACVVFNLHVDHQAAAIENARGALIRLIDQAVAHRGSYYLTYHRFARPDQLLTCHPQIREWLAHKDRMDPSRLFQSDWYHHLLRVIGEEAP